MDYFWFTPAFIADCIFSSRGLLLGLVKMPLWYRFFGLAFVPVLCIFSRYLLKLKSLLHTIALSIEFLQT